MKQKKEFSQILSWLEATLNNLQIHQDYETNIVVETPWSTVIKVNTDKRTYYLKQTPPDLFLEPKVIDFIKKNSHASQIPKVIAVNEKINCFLMNSCGDYSLRTRFNGELDDKLLFQGLKPYLHIHRTLENYYGDAFKLNIPDWRTKNFAETYKSLLQQKQLLLEEGLEEEEIIALKELLPKVESICKILSEQKVKDTLVNCDFNENNMIFDENTQNVSIIDWGEVVISHPFLSIASHMRNIAHRYKLELNGKIMTSLKQKCLSYWADIEDIDGLEKIYESVIKILPIFTVQSLLRLQNATNNQSKKIQRLHIGDVLRTLLKNNL